ncbi:hypothetical protein [Burkholderia ambifaria]|uniref:hypothetical protein n=1 Tax=Burkholderia ambifaria TaxID=152480 RepID=UPI000F80B8F4|nr:hypothetical protein [Burkholderia ambifaria]
MTAHTCNRVELAHEQLETAIAVFLERRSYAATITLAAAAELVLGQSLRRTGQQAILDWQFDAADLVHTALHGRPLERKSFNDAQNRVAKVVRHFDATDAPDFEADLEEAACWMLVRACENAHRLGLTVQGFDAFNDWFYEHIVGV